MDNKPCTGQHPDTDRVDQLIELFRFRDREALDVWLDEGAPMFDDAVDSPNLIREDETYRVKTDKDREAALAAALEQKRRFVDGEMSPTEALIYVVLQRYVERLSRSVFQPITYFKDTSAR